jgi:hypothetical protein
LRFSGAAAASLRICSECGAPLQIGVAARDIVGYRLHDPQDPPNDAPIAVQVALPLPGPLVRP